jgi:hypothetical protein
LAGFAIIPRLWVDQKKRTSSDITGASGELFSQSKSHTPIPRLADVSVCEVAMGQPTSIS